MPEGGLGECCVTEEAPLRALRGRAKRYSHDKHKGPYWSNCDRVAIKTNYGPDREPTVLAIPLCGAAPSVSGRTSIGAVCVSLMHPGRDKSKMYRTEPLDDEECQWMIDISQKLGLVLEQTRKRTYAGNIVRLPQDRTCTHEDIFQAAMKALAETVPHAMHYLVKVDEVGKEEEVYDKETIEGYGSFNRWGFTVAQLDLYSKAFRLFDDDQSGNISTDELGAVLRGVGKNVTEKQVEQLINEFDKDESGSLEWKEFLDLNYAIEERRKRAREKKQRDLDKEIEEASRTFEEIQDSNDPAKKAAMAVARARARRAKAPKTVAAEPPRLPTPEASTQVVTTITLNSKVENQPDESMVATPTADGRTRAGSAVSIAEALPGTTGTIAEAAPRHSTPPKSLAQIVQQNALDHPRPDRTTSSLTSAWPNAHALGPSGTTQVVDPHQNYFREIVANKTVAMLDHSIAPIVMPGTPNTNTTTYLDSEEEDKSDSEDLDDWDFEFVIGECSILERFAQMQKEPHLSVNAIHSCSGRLRTDLDLDGLLEGVIEGTRVTKWTIRVREGEPRYDTYTHTAPQIGETIMGTPYVLIPLRDQPIVKGLALMVLFQGLEEGSPRTPLDHPEMLQVTPENSRK